jgi:hypothetical protein
MLRGIGGQLKNKNNKDKIKRQKRTMNNRV